MVFARYNALFCRYISHVKPLRPVRKRFRRASRNEFSRHTKLVSAESQRDITLREKEEDEASALAPTLAQVEAFRANLVKEGWTGKKSITNALCAGRSCYTVLSRCLILRFDETV